MREFAKSFFSYSLALSLFSLRQALNLMAGGREGETEGPASKAFRGVTKATLDQFDETLTSAFRMFDNVQRGLVSWGFSFFTPSNRPLGEGEARRGVFWTSEPGGGGADRNNAG